MTQKRKHIGLAFALMLVAAAVAPAQEEQTSPEAMTFTSLFSFNRTDGSVPNQGLVQGLDGNVYGTTTFGGTGCFGLGVAFKVTPGGAESTLYNFGSQPNCVDGYLPDSQGALALDPQGNLWGTTGGGGVNNSGTIFKLTPSGTLSTLYAFLPGTFTYSSVVRGSDGNFYGVMPVGGANSNSLYCQGYLTCGAAFRITPKGAFSIIYNFCSQPNCADGAIPTAQLISGIDGNLYGTTASGGMNQNYGTVFKLSLSGKLTTLHSFDGTDGGSCFPCASLVQANDGNLYGTTINGGATGNGTFFKLTPSGSFTTLYNFCSQANCADGGNPLGFVQGTDGSFYGAASNQNLAGCGTLFKVTAGGILTTLHSFTGADGCYPVALVQDTNGTFYGESTSGGTNSDGTLFSLSVGLKPFIKTLELSGKVGATVQILGTNLTGATAVSFNGVAAAFTVKSATLISATVPVGATSGLVTVTIPAGTLKSNTIFRVR